MPAMTALEPLFEEHRLIRVAIAAITALSDTAGRDRRISPEPFLQFQDFIRLFADRAHHSKEELLFRQMVETGMPEGSGPLAVMLLEHEQGREYCETMGAAARACRGGQWHRQTEMLQSALAYCQLLAAHTEREDLVIFPMALEVIRADRLGSLGQLFRQVDPSTPKQFEEATEAVVKAAQRAGRALESAALMA